jgi:ElaB/YqjD/DUF883 family membrane-anchored ribosome-binding protein
MMEEAKNFAVVFNGELLATLPPNLLKEFLHNEIDHWNWLRKIQEAGQVGEELYKKFILKHIEPIIHDIEQTSTVHGSSNIIETTYPFFSSTSKEGKLVENTRKKFGDMTAALLLVYLSSSSKTVISSTPALQEIFKTGVYSYEQAIALKIATTHLDFGIFGEKIDTSFTKLLEKSETQISASIDRVKEKEKTLAERMISIDSEHREWTSKAEQVLARRMDLYKDLAKKTRNEAKDSLDEARESLKNAKKDVDSAYAAYHAEVDLNASVEYWTARCRSHKHSKRIWLGLTLAFMIMTFGALVSYYYYGAASGLSSHKIISAQATASEITTNSSKGPAPTTSTDPKADVTTQAPNLVNIIGKSPSEISLIVTDLAGAALLIALFGVLIRIGLRQFNTYSHFELESAERITFIKTYIALLSEGKLKGDDDRKVILESLFRSSQPGTSSEIPFSSPIELVLKTLDSKK